MRATRKETAPASEYVVEPFVPGALCIELPLPPKALSPNEPIHWAKKSPIIKQYRSQCAYLMHEQEWETLPQFEGVVKVHLDFYLHRDPSNKFEYFPRDEDNARSAFKAGQDALKDIGIIKGDSKKFLRMGETRLRTTKPEHQGRACVVMTLEQIA
jgi:hypothetical protein